MDMGKPYPILRWFLLPILRSRIWTLRGVENLPQNGGYIVTPNHQSWVDSGILAGALYRHLHTEAKFVSQSNKYGMFGGLPIESTDRSHVLDVAIRYAQAGHPIVIFPEGNSNREVELRMGKTGAARLALRTGLPVVPVGIRGTSGVRAWAAFIWFWSLFRPCHVVIGQPVRFPKTEIKDNDAELLRTTTDEIMRRISELSGKPMPGEGPILGRRGWLWMFLWRVFRPLVQWRVRVYGKNHVPVEGPFIVAANHASYFDAPTLSIATFHVSGLQPLFLTKASIAKKWQRLVGRSGLNALGMLPLDEEDRSKVLGAAIEHLRHGGVIGIFPEGTRNSHKRNPNWRRELLRGKTGAVRLMLATGAPIVPVAIQAPKGVSVKESVLKSFLPWHFTRVTFGQPVKFTGQPPSLDAASKADLDSLTRQLMNRIGDLTDMKYPH